MKRRRSRPKHASSPKAPTPSTTWWIPWKERLWPILFWGWALGVTLWLELTPRGEIAAIEVGQAFSHIAFTNVRFEQLDEANTRITLQAPSAWMDYEASQLVLTQPQLSWQRAADDVVFHASGEMGAFDVQTDESDLPSEFHTLEISGAAQATSGNFSVEAERLVFDNPLKIFYIPPGIAYEMRRGEYQSRGSRSTGMYFDPIMQRMNSNLEVLLENRDAASALSFDDDGE